MVCSVEDCNSKVNVDGNHSTCHKHRPCNNNGRFDPESCNDCVTRINIIFNHSDGFYNAVKQLKAQISLMRDSSAFGKKCCWLNCVLEKQVCEAMNPKRETNSANVSNNNNNDSTQGIVDKSYEDLSKKLDLFLNRFDQVVKDVNLLKKGQSKEAPTVLCRAPDLSQPPPGFQKKSPVGV